MILSIDFLLFGGDNPQQLMDEYEYQPQLTQELDALNPDEFNREKLYEIILWKLNRFPQIDDELLVKIQTLSKLQPKEHRSSKETLKELLASWY